MSDVLKAHYISADYFTDPTAEGEVESMRVGVRSYDLLTKYKNLLRQIMAGQA